METKPLVRRLSVVALILASLVAAESAAQAGYVRGVGGFLDPDSVLPVGTRRHDRPDSSYLNLAGGSAFAPVGRILGGPSPANPQILGSGTLVAPEWVLTAAHVIDATAFPAGGFRFTVGGQDYFGVEKVIHPDWTGANYFDGVDIALLRLDRPVAGVAPAALNSGTNELGRAGTYVGFGATGTGLTGYDPFSLGTKRAGDNVIDVAGDFFLNVSSRVLFSDFDHPTNPAFNIFGSATPLDLEYMLAPGDSGGALFQDFGAGPVLTGVNSFITSFVGQPRAFYGEVSAVVRVSSHIGFIQATIGPTGVIPEPSSLVLAGVGLGGLLLIRRRLGDAA